MTRTSLVRRACSAAGSVVSAGGAGFSASLAIELLVNAICLPSGDHSGLPAPRGIFVTWRGSPPPIESRKTCAASGRPASSGARTNASCLPSGDQRGDESRGPMVRRRGSLPPAVGTVHSEVS
jgi:hypothetical protein